MHHAVGGSVRLFASLRPADPLTLGETAERLAAAGVDGLHIDIADGRFVPYMTVGPSTASALAERFPKVLIDVHLMTESPEDRLRELHRVAGMRVAFHVEATQYPWRIVSLARELGCEVGVALNPVTPIATIEALARSIDFVNLLTTDPDHAGEPLLPGMTERVAAVRALVPGAVRIEVDGGVNGRVAAQFVAAGANDLVLGRAIVGTVDWAATVAELRAAVGRPVA